MFVVWHLWILVLCVLHLPDILYYTILLQFEEATGTLPDITLPISDQLEQAIATIKNNVRVIIETQTESRSIKSVSSE